MNYQTAVQLAITAHHGQMRGETEPYVNHPLRVANAAMTLRRFGVRPGDYVMSHCDEQIMCIAVLHDVVEDSIYTLETLKLMGFHQDVIDGVELLTHDDNEPYQDYLERIILSDNVNVILVKLLDAVDNAVWCEFDDERYPNWRERRKKYFNAITQLTIHIKDESLIKASHILFEKIKESKVRIKTLDIFIELINGERTKDQFKIPESVKEINNFKSPWEQPPLFIEHP